MGLLQRPLWPRRLTTSTHSSDPMKPSELCPRLGANIEIFSPQDYFNTTFISNIVNSFCPGASPATRTQPNFDP